MHSCRSLMFSVVSRSQIRNIVWNNRSPTAIIRKTTTTATIASEVRDFLDVRMQWIQNKLRKLRTLRKLLVCRQNSYEWQVSVKAEQQSLVVCIEHSAEWLTDWLTDYVLWRHMSAAGCCCCCCWTKRCAIEWSYVDPYGRRLRNRYHNNIPRSFSYPIVCRTVLIYVDS